MKKATRIITPILGASLLFGAIGVSAHETVTVESGDTYWGIAQEYNDVTTEDLMEVNEYNPYAIPIGAEITVPKENLVIHVIQPGNTLAQIAATYDGVSVDDLFRLNPEIDPYNLMIGSEVVVVNYDRELGEDYLYHTVQPGNTFYNIASVYDGVSVNDLIHANPNEDPYELTIGSQIVIPLN